jgi:hypothetical protein
MQVRFLPGALPRRCYLHDSPVAEQTLEQTGPPPAAAAAASASLPGGLAVASRHPWPLGTAALVLVSVAVVRVANCRPGFDPYGWLVWGHQTLIGSLDTNAAPSWKPLPYLFTVPFALAGHLQLWLWMVTAVAISLSGMVFAARLAYRLTAAPAGRRWAAILAALVAAAALNTITQRSPTYSVWHYILSDQSDPMIVALCLGAIDCHLSGRHRWAFVLGALASLGRPEVWAFLGPYAIWAWRARPSMRPLLAAGTVAIAALWFGIPAITSRSPFVAADNAFYSGRRLHGDLVFGTISRFLDLQPRGLELAGLLSVVLAVWRRDRVTLALAGAVVVWVAVEIATVIHGWPGVPRYMFEPAGLLGVVAAVGLGRALVESPQLPTPLGLGALALVAALLASALPTALSDARAEHRDLREQRLRTRTLGLLSAEIAGYGGPDRFHPCGEPLTRLQYQSAVAWSLRLNVSSVGYKYGPALASTRPIVLFTPYPQSGSGWQIRAAHQRLASCRAIPGS